MNDNLSSKKYLVWHRYINIIFLLFSTVLSLYAQRSWTWQNPLPQGNDLYAIQCIDAHTIYAVGAAGTILKSTNGGFNWIPQDSGIGKSISFRSLAFRSNQLGWVVGESGTILKTSDGGNSWESRELSIRITFNSVWAIAENKIIAIGDSGIIFRSTNGGSSWSHISANTNKHLRSIFFINSSIGYIVGDDGTILKTVDGGNSWFVLNGYITGNLNSVYFINAESGWAVGAFRDSIRNTSFPNGRFWNVLQTTDGGLNWTPKYTGTPINLSLYSLKFVSANKAYAVGDGIIVSTTSGGDTWRSESFDAVNTLHSLSFFDSTVGWAVGSNGEIKKTSDGGSTWFRQITGARSEIYGISVPNTANMYAVSDSGVVIHSTNGGDIWNIKNTLTPNRLSSVYFFAPNAGCAVGDKGTIVRTINSGSTWEVSTLSPFDFTSVYFSDGIHGWAVGGKGIIYNTEDAGTNWDSVKIDGVDTSINLTKVYFFDNQNGWIIGIFGQYKNYTKFFKTTNGGAKWLHASSDSTMGILSVFFLDPLLGWAVGQSKNLLKTIDGGYTWIPQYTPLHHSTTFYDVQFSSETTGLIVGGTGYVFKTINGGKDWNPMTTGTNRTFRSIAFVDSLRGWIVGSNGTIMRTNDGGGVIPPPPPPPQKPPTVGIQQSIPNPFYPFVNGVTYFPFRINNPSIVRIKIYNLLGKLVRDIDAGYFEKGVHVGIKDNQTQGTIISDAPSWDGRDNHGINVPSGIYFYTIKTAEFIESKKLVLLR